MNEEGGFQPRSTAPVNVGDELDVTIESVGAKGDGVTKKDGFVIFVPGVQKGDNVRIKVTRVLRKVGFGEVVGSDGSASSDESSEEPAPEEQPDAEQSQADEQPAPEQGQADEQPAPAEGEGSSKDTEDFGEE